MAKIQWSVSTINSFFKTSLNQKNSQMDGIYNSLNDASMIKKGSYSKLMKAYYSELKEKKDSLESKEKSDTSTYNNMGQKTERNNSVLDELI